MFFDGFTLGEKAIGGVTYRFRQGGAGPLLMLLHGQPQTHATWHKVAPALARNFTVLCPDLVPSREPEDLAADLLELGLALGGEKMFLAGQDVGGMLAARMALRAPAAIDRLALLQCLPAPSHGGRTDMAFELSTYESCWFGQLHPKPEARSLTQPAEWQANDGDSIFSPEAISDYLAHSPWLDMSGAALSFTPLSLAGDARRIECPVLVLWGESGRIGGWYDPADLWREHVCGPVTSSMLPGGTFLAEESPQAVLTALEAFFE